MKLQKLIISNFRGLKGNKNIINFADSNIIFLIGQNNVGKSTSLMPSITSTMHATLPTAQRVSMVSAATRRMIQLPMNRPIMNTKRAAVMTIAADLSAIHPMPVTKLMK